MRAFIALYDHLIITGPNQKRGFQKYSKNFEFQIIFFDMKRVAMKKEIWCPGTVYML